jgi:hypothetical protein
MLTSYGTLSNDPTKPNGPGSSVWQNFQNLFSSNSAPSDPNSTMYSWSNIGKAFGATTLGNMLGMYGVDVSGQNGGIFQVENWINSHIGRVFAVILGLLFIGLGGFGAVK